MKKRILSILLAVMMVVPMLTMAIPVSAAGVSNNYSYKFEAEDARNYIEGQVVDLGAIGEAVVAPAMNGELTAYQTSKVFVEKEGNELTVHYAVKDGYLYAALVTNDTEPKTNQFDIGLSQYASSDTISSRLRLKWQADGNLSWGGALIKYPEQGVEGTKYADKVNGDWASTDLGYSTGFKAEAFIVDKKFTNGIYEIKLNISSFYRFYFYTVRGEGIYETPCMTMFFFYDLYDGNEVPYFAGFPDAGHTIGGSSCVAYNYPVTIILPQETLEYVNGQRGVTGELGLDWRNAVENQLSKLDKYATSPSQIDGTVDGNDNYSVVKKLEGANVDDVTLRSAITEDGFVYLAVTYPEAADSTNKVQFEVGLCNNTAALNGASRLSVYVPSEGEFTHHSASHLGVKYPYKWANDEDLFGGVVAYSTVKQDLSPFKEVKRDNADGYTTVEAKIALTPLYTLLNEAGWDIYDLNSLTIMFYRGTGSHIGFPIDENLKTTLMNNSVGCCNYATVYPVVEFPAGAPERFFVDGIDDLEPYGQKHAVAVKNGQNVTLDGVISEGEYGTSVNSTTSAFEQKGINIVNYVTADDDYYYVASQITDPYYTPSGNSASYCTYQLYLPPSDGVVDVSDGNKRVQFSVMHYLTAPTYVGAPGAIWRTQGGKDAYTAEQTTIKGILKPYGDAKTFAYAGSSYDAETNTVIYETKINKEALNKCFGYPADASVDTLMFFFTYYTEERTWVKDSWLTPDLDENYNSAKQQTSLQYMTRANNNGDLAYGDTYIPNVVVRFVDDAATKNTASARISTQNAGLRFTTVYSNAYLEEMKAYATEKGVEMKVGTLIAPNDYVERSGAFTHKALGAGNYVQVFGDVENAFAKGSGTTTIAGSIVDIKEKNLGRDFAGIGFIQIGDEYFYSDTYAVRNVSSVANAALNDTKSAAMVGYKYLVSEGVYSPYSAGQRTILGELIAK